MQAGRKARWACVLCHSPIRFFMITLIVHICPALIYESNQIPSAITPLHEITLFGIVKKILGHLSLPSCSFLVSKVPSLFNGIAREGQNLGFEGHLCPLMLLFPSLPLFLPSFRSTRAAKAIAIKAVVNWALLRVSARSPVLNETPPPPPLLRKNV